METALLIFAALVIGILIGFLVARALYLPRWTEGQKLPPPLPPSGDIGPLVENLPLTSSSGLSATNFSMTTEMADIGVASTEDAIPPLSRRVRRAYISEDRPTITARGTVGERRPVSRN